MAKSLRGKFRVCKNWVRNNKLAAVLFLVLVINLLVNLTYHSFNKAHSDFVSFFLLRDSFFSEQVFIPENSYFLKLPFYFLSSLVWGLTRENIVFLNLLNAVLMLAGFILLYRELVKQHTGSKKFNLLLLVLPLFVLINQSSLFWREVMHPFCRNSEMGLICLVLYLRTRDKTAKYSTLFLVFCLSLLLFFSDPYWIFTFAIPYLLAIGLIWLKHKTIDKQDRYLCYYFLMAVVASVLYRYMINLSDYFTLYTNAGSLVPSDRIIYNIKIAGEGLLRLFNAYIFEGDLLSLAQAGKVVNLGILLMATAGLAKLFRDKLNARQPVWVSICISFVITFLAYAGSTMLKDIGTTRYLIPLMLWAAFGLYYFFIVIGGRYTRCRIAAGVLITLGLPLNIFMLGPGLPGIPQVEDQYRTQFALIHAIEEEGLSYGYGEYWDAVLTTYLAQEQIKIRQVDYWFGKVSLYPLLTSSAWYEPDSYQGPSFLLIRQNMLDQEIGTFSLAELLSRQFGGAQKIRTIVTSDAVFKLFVYDYNIAQNFVEYQGYY